jgi:hypothetical protein
LFEHRKLGLRGIRQHHDCVIVHEEKALNKNAFIYLYFQYYVEFCVPLVYGKRYTGHVLTLVRRHTRACKTKKHIPTIELRKCACPLAFNGVDRDGKYRSHEALGTKDLDTAAKLLLKIDLGEPLPTPAPNRMSLVDGFERFKLILTGQKQVLPQSITTNVLPLQKSMLAFADHKGLSYVDQVDQDFIDEWVGSWDWAQNTRAKLLGVLSRFLETAQSREWTGRVPIIMKPKRQQGGTTQPFDLEREDGKILAAAWKWETAASRAALLPSPWKREPRMVTGFIYLLRATGLRFSDAIRFDPRALVKRSVRGKDVYCYYEPHQLKTGNPVFIPLPAEMAEPIINSPRLTGIPFGTVSLPLATGPADSGCVCCACWRW